MNIVKLKINGTKLAILGIYAPCSYLKVHDEKDKSFLKKIKKILRNFLNFLKDNYFLKIF